MSINKLHNQQIAEEAADWAVKLDGGSLTKQDKEALALWLSESSLHVDELLLSASIMTGLGDVDRQKEISIDTLLKDTAPEVVPLFSALARKGSKVSVVRHYFAGIAALFLFAIIGLYIFGTGAPDQIAFVTKTGEQRSLTLSDGSVIHVNTETDIRIDYKEAERRVVLLSGEAMFEVAHDTARPFRVYSGGTVTKAVGTIFNVHHIGGMTKVAVLEGTVAVRGDATDQLFKAGEQASISEDGHVTAMNNPNMQAVVSWRMRTLVFKSDTLATIAIEFNRYNHEQIYVDDKTTSSLQFSGIFNADDPHSFIKYLETSNAVNVDRSRQSEFHLTAPTNINRSKTSSAMQK